MIKLLERLLIKDSGVITHSKISNISHLIPQLLLDDLYPSTRIEKQSRNNNNYKD